MNINAPPFVPSRGSTSKPQLSDNAPPLVPSADSPSKPRLDKDLLAKRTFERFIPPRLRSASSEPFESDPKKVEHIGRECIMPPTNVFNLSLMTLYHPAHTMENNVNNNTGGSEIKGESGSLKTARSTCALDVPLSGSIAATTRGIVSEAHEATNKPSPISRDVSPGTRQLPHCAM